MSSRPRPQHDRKLQSYQEAFEKLLRSDNETETAEQFISQVIDEQVERQVLGEVLFSEDHAEFILDRLGYGPMSDVPFFNQRHALIYLAMVALAKKSVPIDLVGLTNQLRAQGQLEMIGTAGYLMSIMNEVTYVRQGEVKHHTQILLNLHARRKLVFESYVLRTMALDHTNLLEAKEIIEQHENSILQVLGGSEAKSGPQSMKAIVRLTQKEIAESTLDGTVMPGFQTGIKTLDQIIGGISKQDVAIIAARPSDGKTALAITIARNIAASTIPEKRTGVAFFSMEMAATKIGMRFLGLEGRINTHRLKFNRLTDWEIKELPKAVAAMEKLPIYIDETPALTALEIRSKVKRLQHSEKVEVVVIDYLQLMKNHDPNPSDTRDREVGKISAAIKQMAKELNVAVILLSQMNRQQTERNRAPVLSDLRESGAIENDADFVIFIYDKNKKSNADDSASYEEGYGRSLELCVEKDRNGMTGPAPARFHKEYSLFEAPVYEAIPETPRAVDFSKHTNYKPRAQFTGASTPEHEYQPSFIPADVEDASLLFDDDPF